jgi:hypothetical protein
MIEFDFLHFTESTLGTPTLDGADLVIPVSGAVLLGDASRMELSRPLSGNLIFKCARRAVRKVTEYIGDPRQPDGFRDPTVREQEFAQPSGNAQEYTLEGFQTEPAAWIDWTIWADSFEFVEHPAD